MNLDFRSEVLLEAAHRFEEAAHERCVCAGCKYAQLFAAQPRALCAHPTAVLRGSILFAGQPACADFVAQRGVDVRLAAHADMIAAARGSAASAHPHAA